MKNKADQEQLGEDILGFADRLTKEDVEKFLPEQMQ